MKANTKVLRENALAIANYVLFDGFSWEEARKRVRIDSGRDAMPDSQSIESAIRENASLFMKEEHAALLLEKRRSALKALELLQEFDAYLCGAVLNGAATEETSLRIEIFTDDPKAVHFALLDKGIAAEVIEDEVTPVPNLEVSLGFLLYIPGKKEAEAVRLEVFPVSSLRYNPRKTTPDSWQESWEASGRIKACDLAKSLPATAP